MSTEGTKQKENLVPFLIRLLYNLAIRENAGPGDGTRPFGSFRVLSLPPLNSLSVRLFGLDVRPRVRLKNLGQCQLESQSNRGRKCYRKKGIE